MKDKTFTTTIFVGQTPKEVFAAINTVRGWWSEEIKGRTDKLGEEFDYHFKDMHRCKIKITELIPSKEVVWRVLEMNSRSQITSSARFTPIGCGADRHLRSIAVDQPLISSRIFVPDPWRDSH